MKKRKTNGVKTSCENSTHGSAKRRKRISSKEKKLLDRAAVLTSLLVGLQPALDVDATFAVVCAIIQDGLRQENIEFYWEDLVVCLTDTQVSPKLQALLDDALSVDVPAKEHQH